MSVWDDIGAAEDNLHRNRDEAEERLREIITDFYRMTDAFEIWLERFHGVRGMNVPKIRREFQKNRTAALRHISRAERLLERVPNSIKNTFRELRILYHKDRYEGWTYDDLRNNYIRGRKQPKFYKFMLPPSRLLAMADDQIDAAEAGVMLLYTSYAGLSGDTA